MNSWKRESTFP